MLTVIGNTVSPYVRKVLTVLRLKGLEFEIDPLTPFFGDDRFTELSPLRQIPVLIDGDAVVRDSSAIVQYLEETRPRPSVFPDASAARAEARWLEEYADVVMGDVFVWKGFGRVVIAPAFFGAERDLKAFAQLVDTEVSPIVDFLETRAPAEGFLCGGFSVADIAVASMFRMLAFARWTPQPALWPRVCAWLDRTAAEPAFAETGAWADALSRTPPPEQREKLASLGLRVTDSTYISDRPRRGPVSRIG
ncbi:MAG: glutathione S-transferase family protein [Alphaproteobacteria bacterium]|nr:glutathione S-transferase family protein [Alphaproteobacteria bacterium]